MMKRSVLQKNVSMIQALTSPKLIAFALIGVSQNNMVTLPIYATMMIMDALFHYYLIVIQILKQGNSKNGSNYAYLSDINVIEHFMNQEAGIAHLITQIGIFLIYVMIIGTFLIFIYQTWSLKSLNNSQTLKKIMTVVYASFMTFMHIPMMLFVFSNFFLDFKNASNPLKILIFCFSGINSLFFVLMTVFLYKLYIIRIPCRSIPWCASNTQLHFMKVINKVLLVVSHLYLSSTGSNILVLECILCLLFTVTGLARIFIIPHYVKLVDWITKLTELSTGLLLFIMIITQTFIHDLKICILLGILIFPCFFGAAVIMDIFRQRQLLRKLEDENIRLEIEYEYLLYILIEMARNSMGWDSKSQYSLSSILYQIEIHNRRCQNYQCPCHMIETVQYIINKGYTMDQDVVEVDESDIDFLNQQGQNIFIQTDKNSASSKTFTVFQVNNIYQSLSDNKSSKKDEGKKGQTVQINIHQLKLTFLNKFIDTFFEDAQKKFPGSKRLFFQYAYFTLYSCKNKFLTETLIRNFDNMKVNWLEKVSIKVNELQTMMEIRNISMLNSNHEEDESVGMINWGIIYESDQNQNLGSKSYNTDSFDPENFILMSLLTNKYYNTIEKLTQNIQGFWRTIQSDSIDVISSYNESMKVAKKVAKIYDIFEEIEGEGKKQDFKLYYVFALIQKFLLNDINSHEMYLNKMNSQRDINRLIRSHLLVAKIEDTGFMLAHGQDKNFGRLILCNQVFRKNLNYSQKDLKHANIYSFMPHLIKEWHSEFVADFNRTGTNGVLNRNTCVFVVKKNGYSVPAMMNIRFHYSKDYEFTFICFLTFMHNMQIQKYSSKTKTEQILFFLCDDTDGRIYDISESCFKQLKFDITYLQNNELGTMVNYLTIEDICPSLSIRKLKELRKTSDNIIAIEEIIDINLNIIQELGNTIKCHQSKIEKALCQVFQEQYGQKKGRCMNIVAITLLDQLEIKNYLNQKKNNRKIKKQQKIEEEKANLTQTQSQLAFSDTNSGKQNSASSGSSCSRTGASTEAIKQLYQTTDKKIPGSLKLIAQLLFVVYIIMITVSTINLILALTRNNNLKSEVNIVRKSYDRITFHAKTRLLLRGMLNMANGYEPLYSELNSDRFTVFQNELQKQISNLKNVQDFLDRAPFDYSQEFIDILDAKSVILSYLDKNNQEYTENQTHSYSNNLYIQRILDVQNWGINELKGNISLMNLKRPAEKYSPSEKERTIYFLIKNAQTFLRYYDRIYSDMYREETINHALEVTYQTQITIIISIAAIFVVSVVISPVLCRMEERKYIGLTFFIFVEHEHIAVLLSNCDEFLQLAFSDGSVHTASSHQETNIIKSKKQRNLQDNQNNFMDSDQIEAIKRRGDGFGSSSSSEENDSQDAFEDSNGSSLNDYASMYSQREVKNNDDQLGSLRSGIETYLKKGVSNMIAGSGIQIPEETENQIQIEEDVDDNIQVNNLGDSQLDVHNDTSQITLNKVETAYKTLEEINIPRDYKYLQQQKLNGIKSIITRKKTQALIGIALICISVSSYFIACFFLAEKSFSQTPEILRYLDLIYSKDSCLENSMTFVRENQILNKTQFLIENPTVSAATFYIDNCKGRESQYIEMRKDIPAVFQEQSSYISDLESDILCEITQQTQEKKDNCNKVFNGILQKGISYTMSLLLNHFQNLDLNFESYPASRTYEMLIQYNKNEQTLRLTELKDFILDEIFIDLKDKVTLSTTNYYATLISYYTIIYGIFVVVMTFFILYFFIFQFKNLRDAMWKTNLTLKIMPMDYVPITCLPDLKKFFIG